MPLTGEEDMALKNTIPAPPHGIYILTKTVKNPRGNHRCKHETWKLLEWKKDSKFVIEYYDPELLPGAEMIRPLNHYHALLFAEGHRPVLDAIVPHLERMEEKTLEQILLAGKTMSGVTPTQILTHLLDSGDLSIITIRDAIVACKRKNGPLLKGE